MNVTCSAESCPVILNSICVFYEGDTLLYTGIVQNDNIQTALQKIDAKFHDAAIGYAFNNGVVQSAPGNPVQLGGALVQDTTINSTGHELYITGNLKSGAFITQGGTSAQFVKGDGTLDGTSYQPAGNYITNLTGDGVANGPGSAILTLASVNGSPGTWGTNGTVPRITVNAKGLITAVSSVAINYPEKSLSFGGDISGLGFTGSLVTLTLPIINSDVFGTNTFLKFGVNGKGLVTSAAAVTHLDIESVLGYVPVTSDRTITINGVTYDLTANRSWTISGSAGTSGTSGTSGSGGGGTGTSGSSGTSGTSGNNGTSGTSGANGTSGINGTSGVSGTAGTSGSTGTSGSSGNSGSSGTSGNSGTSGVSGTSGSSGVSGTSGVNGTSGVSGTSGSSGNSGTSGVSGTSGTSGTSGNTGTSGTSGANGTSGVNGTSGTSGANGAAGTSGVNGTSGTTGTSGTSGTSGSTGTSGTSGNGTSGTSGNNGTSGTSGLDASGTSGTSGNSGTSGTSGNGTSGTSGSTGTSGTSGQIDYTPLIMIGGTI